MKKFCQILIALLLVAAMVTAFAACAAKTDNTADTTAAVPPTSETTANAPGDDGQNAVMNFIGDYDNGGCYIHVEAEGSNDAVFTVEWPMTDDMKETYTFSGTLDIDTLTVTYSNSTKKVLTLDANGNVTNEKAEYTDGSGKVIFREDGTLEWLDENEAERMIDNTVFSFVYPE